MEEKEPKNQLRKWAVFTGIAFEMGGTIFGCAWIGKKLDERYGNPEGTNWFTLGFILFGVASSLFIVLQQLKKMNN